MIVHIRSCYIKGYTTVTQRMSKVGPATGEGAAVVCAAGGHHGAHQLVGASPFGACEVDPIQPSSHHQFGACEVDLIQPSSHHQAGITALINSLVRPPLGPLRLILYEKSLN